MDLHLTGKVALITGPAKGMGSAITLAFAREGCDLVLAGRDTTAIEPVAEAARDLGRRAMVVSCDLTGSARCEAGSRQ
jgi:NAD(P)-dependent dehydrogenase (short-subunit alcohol dehydrogenase family)